MDEEMYSWYAAMAVVWGREKAQRFMRALAKQDIQLRSGQSLIAQLMAAGEFQLGMALAHRIEKMKEQGAPVEWVTTLNPITVSLHPIAVAAKAPHSNAAQLFIDFVLSKVGQQVVLAMGRTPSRPGSTQDAVTKFKAFPISPELREKLQPIPERIPRAVSLVDLSPLQCQIAFKAFRLDHPNRPD